MNFKFDDSNGHGVCLNPHRISILENSKVSLTIKVASRNNVWSFGYSFEKKYGDHAGSHSGVWMPLNKDESVFSKEFTNMDDCISEAKQKALKWMKSNNKDGLLNQCIVGLKDDIDQLSLF